MSQLLDVLAAKKGLEKADALEHYLIRKAFEKGIPLFGHFELTPRCTLDCAMCYVHLTREQMYRPELTTDEWLSLIDQACDAGMMYATLSGGECLLYPGLWEIFDRLQARGVLVTVLTNGTLLDAEMVMRLSVRHPKRVQISVYGSGPDGYERVTGNADAFYRVDKAIDLLIEAELPVNFAVTVTKQMLPDVEEILKYCDSKKDKVTIVNSYLFESRSNTGRKFENFALSAVEQDEIYGIEQKLYSEGNKQGLADEEAQQKLMNKRKNGASEIGLDCTAGRFGFAIRWDGKMTPCCVFDYAGKYPLDEGFLSSWMYINKKCSEYKNPVECIDCCSSKACRRCPADHYMKVGEGKVNLDVCNDMKRLIEVAT